MASNDNAPESERWVPVEVNVLFPAASNGAGKWDMNRDRSRREAEAVIAKHFPAR